LFVESVFALISPNFNEKSDTPQYPPHIVLRPYMYIMPRGITKKDRQRHQEDPKRLKNKEGTKSCEAGPHFIKPGIVPTPNHSQQ